MQARYFLALCVALVIAGVFVAPCTVWIGFDRGLATDLTGISVIGGLASALMAVRSDAQDRVP